MLFHSSALAFALTVSLVNGGYIPSGSYASAPSTGSDYVSTRSTGSDYASTPSTGYANKQGYTSNKSKAVSTFATTQASIVKYGPIFKNSLKSGNTKDVISGLVDIRASILSLGAQVNVGVGNVGVGIWIGADLNIFANLYVSLLAKLQVVLKIIHSYGQVDACQSSILALNAPLKALLSVFVKAGIDIGGLIGVQVDLGLFVSVGISLGISVSVNANVGAGADSGFGLF